MLERYDRHRIARLVLMNAPVYPQEFTTAVQFMQLPVLPYAALTLLPKEVPVTIALMTEAVGLNQITNQDIDIYSQPYADAGARHAIIQTARQISPPDAKRIMAAYRRVRQPALIIWCRHDQVVPLATGQRLHRDLPRSRIKVLDGCDHVSPEQRPVTIARAIRRFAR